jgi:RNA 3'-terminal phosphate cyclase (ATP)
VPGVEGTVRDLGNEAGPGNALVFDIVHEHVTEVFTGFGERGVTAESIGQDVARAALRYLQSTAAVDEHLADQLVLPMALAGAGSFTAVAASSHLLTNIGVIEKFLPVSFDVETLGRGAPVRVRVQ